MTALAFLLALPAYGGAVTTSANAGWDFRDSALWSGVELAIHPTNTEGTAFIGRLNPSWGFSDEQPRVLGEFGFATVVPQKEQATVRAGLVAQVLYTRAQHTMPIVLSSDELYSGLVPAGMGLVEFEYGENWRYAIGARAGVGPEITNIYCDSEIEPSCLRWTAGFAGGFYARMRLSGGFAAELAVGPSSSLAVGWAW